MKYSSVTAKQPVFKQRFENLPRFSKYAEIKLNLPDIFLIYITYSVSKKPEPTNNGNTNNTNLEALLHDYSLISGHCKRRSLVRLCVYLSNIFLRQQIGSICIYLALCLSYKLYRPQERPHWSNQQSAWPGIPLLTLLSSGAYDREQQGTHTSLIYPPHFQQSAAQRHLQWQAVSKTQRYIFFFPCMCLIGFESIYISGS